MGSGEMNGDGDSGDEAPYNGYNDSKQRLISKLTTQM